MQQLIYSTEIIGAKTHDIVVVSPDKCIGIRPQPKTGSSRDIENKHSPLVKREKREYFTTS